MSTTTTTGVRLPTATIPEESWHFGAYVADPVAGLHEHVVYPDLASMYPSLMIMLNISPETVVGTQEELDESEWCEDDCVWGYVDERPVKRVSEEEPYGHYCEAGGAYKAVGRTGESEVKWTDEPRFDRYYFLKPSIRTGMLSSAVETVMSLNAQYKGTDMYAASKSVRNSMYGYVTMGDLNKASRVFDVRLGECVTLSGQKVIRWTTEEFTRRVGRDHDEQKPHVIFSDTDSCATAFPSATSQQEVIERSLEVAAWINDVGYDTFARETFGTDGEYLKLDIESYASKVYIHSAKKRYIQRIRYDEGDSVDEIQIKGFECRRSDVADVTEEVQREVLESLVMQESDMAKKCIAECLQGVCEEIYGGEYPIEELGKRSGFGKDPTEYGTAKKRAPTIRRGAKYANQHCGENIGKGDKPFGFPVTRVLDDSLPKTYSADTGEDGDEVDYIAATDPNKLEGKFELDYETIVAKTIEGPIKPIIETMQWDYDAMVGGQVQTDITDYW